MCSAGGEITVDTRRKFLSTHYSTIKALFENTSFISIYFLDWIFEVLITEALDKQLRIKISDKNCE